nr:hypothetical protein [Legionella tunisiensis]
MNFLLAATMSIVLRGWQEMSAFLVAILMVSYAVGPLCLICLRKQLPDYKRPFRLPCSGFIAFIGFYVCTVGVYWSGFHSVRKLLVVTFLVLVFSCLYCFIKKCIEILMGNNRFGFYFTF